MKGIIRKIDNSNRLVIPKEYYKELGLDVGDKVEMILDDGMVKIKKFNTMKYQELITDLRKAALGDPPKITEIKNGIYIQGRGVQITIIDNKIAYVNTEKAYSNKYKWLYKKWLDETIILEVR